MFMRLFIRRRRRKREVNIVLVHNNIILWLIYCPIICSQLLEIGNLSELDSIHLTQRIKITVADLNTNPGSIDQSLLKLYMIVLNKYCDHNSQKVTQ